jgi:alkylhydroperoxidase family enzyme
MELNSALSRAHGVSESELQALAHYENAPQFSERERAALAYAEVIARSNTVPQSLFSRVEKYFNQDEIVELTAIITWEVCAAKLREFARSPIFQRLPRRVDQPIW